MQQQTHAKSKKWLPIIIIIGVIIIPLMYSFFYLDAFWDPYSRLNTLPVAVVNEDKGAVIDGKNRNLGKEMWDQLNADGTLKFMLTDKNDALKGTEGDSYYALICIPENFSVDIASSGTINKRQAEIFYAPNEKRNYLASQILGKAVLEVEKSTRASVDKELVKQLSGKLYEVPGQLESLQDGLGQLNDGASQLENGTDSLQDGVGMLESGTSDLKDGAETLAQGTSTLVQGTGGLAVGTQSLEGGAETLADGTIALKDGTASLANGAASLFQGTNSINIGANDLATGTSQFSRKMQEYKKGEATANAGADQLADGAVALSSGIEQLNNGLNKLSQRLDSSMAELDAGVGQLKIGFDDYQTGANSLIDSSSGMVTEILTIAKQSPELLNDPYFNELYQKAQAIAQNAQQFEALKAGGQQIESGLNALDTKIQEGIVALTDPQTGVPALLAGAQEAQNGADTLTTGSDTLKQGMKGLDAATSQLAEGAISLNDGAEKLAEGASQTNVGATDLNVGAKRINDAAMEVSSGAGSLAEGTAQANAGAQQVDNGAVALNSGAKTLSNATATLYNGTGDLGTGVVKLRDGSIQLKDGLDQAKTGVDDNLTKVEDQLKPLKGLDSYAADPLTVNTNAIDPVPNYGTAFAPYFLSLSLWVGALIIFFGIYFDADEKFNLLSRRSDKRVIRSLCYLVIGLFQAVLLAVVLQFGLGLHVNHLGAFYLSCGLVSMVFIALVQFFIVVLKDVGKFIAIALLILQLTSCGGTFPMETVPKFFNILYPFMPMTYSVGLFKEAISGTGPMVFDTNAIILIGILVVVMALTILFSDEQQRKNHKLINAEAPH